MKIPLYYRKHVYMDHYHDGEKYIHHSVVEERMKALLENQLQMQQRYIDAENLLMKILDNKICSFIFGKKIREHIKKYKNLKLKF